jgi:outer membrane biosynthesis protein TonB
MQLSSFILILLAMWTLQCNRHPSQTGDNTSNQPQQINQSSSKSKKECDFAAYKPLRFTSTLGSPAISMPKPDYPPEAKGQKIEGIVRVKLLINVRSGLVEQACVIEGDEILGQAAKTAALKVKVSPYNNYIKERYNYAEGVVSYNFVA